MELTISGRHVDVTDAMREHARQRAEKLEHLGPQVMHTRVTLTIESDRQLAEVLVKVRGKDELVAKAVSHDMYISIDQAIGKMEKQLQKVEERFKQRRTEARKKRTSAGTIPAEESPEEGEALEEEVE